MEVVKIYEKKFDKLIENGVHAVNLDGINNQEEQLVTKIEDRTNKHSTNLTCSYCRIEFVDVQQQREHYKLDWHRYNLKQNLLSKEPITEELFNDKTDDISSISGSDTEKEDSLDYVATLQGKLFLRTDGGRVFSLYRCLLFERKVNITDPAIISQRFKEIKQSNLWTVLMLGGGHFAGAVFQGNNPILHKTFHCYTVRAGQGSSQGSRDSKSGGGSQPKSAGASLRRYNEQALVQHVKEILITWKEEIAKSDVIVYRAAGPYNKAVLFGGKPAILERTDVRLISVPFCTRRATFAEVKRVYDVLTTVQVYDSLEVAHEKFSVQVSPDRDTKRNKSKSTVINRAKSRETTPRPLPVALITSSESDEQENGNKITYDDTEINFKDCLESFGDSLTPEERKLTKHKKKPKKSKSQKLKEQEEQRKQQIRDMVREGNEQMLTATLTSFKEETDERQKFMCMPLDEHGNTILHLAALYDQNDLVKFLLESGFDVCLRNQKQQTPYTVTQNKEIREIFKAFAQKHPDKHNYNKANIPIITATAEEVAEKKRQLRKIKREKEKVKKMENEVKKQEEMEKERFLKLSDREKRALAAERRILDRSGTVTARCFLCAADISGKVPFEYMGNRFCTVDCLKAHRMQNPIKLS